MSLPGPGVDVAVRLDVRFQPVWQQGAQTVLLDAVDSAAAPVVLEVLRRVFG